MKQRTFCYAGTTLIALLLLCGFSCPNLASSGRNTGAALQGMINSAQTQYKASCTANPAQSVCKKINQAVAAQNVLITATETYCGWSTTNPPANPNAPCVPVASAAQALQAAIANATTFINELKGAL